jgi:uncharacterized membrane protein (UPF0127 family)
LKALVGLVLLAALLWAPMALAPREGSARTVSVGLAGESFELELATDPVVQFRGLSGRKHIDPNGGMLFAYPSPRLLTFVMRDCPVPIDIAFLDSQGRVISVQHMTPEEPRRALEDPNAYEARLHRYRSPLPAQYAIETAGGRLRELGLRGGDRVELDRDAIFAGRR